MSRRKSYARKWERLLSFFVPGNAIGKKTRKTRAMLTKEGRPFASSFKDPATRKYETLVKMAAQEAKARAGITSLIDAAVRLTLIIYKQPPASLTAKQRAMGPITKPDNSNVRKSIEDGMEGVIFTNDARVAVAADRKEWADEEHPPGVLVVVEHAVLVEVAARAEGAAPAARFLGESGA